MASRKPLVWRVYAQATVLSNGQCRVLAVVGQAGGALHVALADCQHPVGRLAHDARNRGKRHLLRKHQHQCLEQQREAREPARKLGLDRAHRASRQRYTRRAHLQMALVLEEVQVPVRLGHGATIPSATSNSLVVIPIPSGLARYMTTDYPLGFQERLL